MQITWAEKNFKCHIIYTLIHIGSFVHTYILKIILKNMDFCKNSGDKHTDMFSDQRAQTINVASHWFAMLGAYRTDCVLS